MHFSFATVIACVAVFVAAQKVDHSGQHRGLHVLKKDITCPTAGGTATLSHPCHTGYPPSGQSKHPHSKPTARPSHSEHPRWDGTVTFYPSNAPETTVTHGVDCQGESGPSCAYITFASPTCSMMPLGTGKHDGGMSHSHKSLPTVSAPMGATKTVHAKHTATCKSAPTTA